MLKNSSIMCDTLVTSHALRSAFSKNNVQSDFRIEVGRWEKSISNVLLLQKKKRRTYEMIRYQDTGICRYKLYAAYPLRKASALLQCGWPVGLGVWFSLRVREVPGSNPGLARQAVFFFVFFLVPISLVIPWRQLFTRLSEAKIKKRRRRGTIKIENCFLEIFTS